MSCSHLTSKIQHEYYDSNNRHQGNTHPSSYWLFIHYSHNMYFLSLAAESKDLQHNIAYSVIWADNHRGVITLVLTCAIFSSANLISSTILSLPCDSHHTFTNKFYVIMLGYCILLIYLHNFGIYHSFTLINHEIYVNEWKMLNLCKYVNDDQWLVFMYKCGLMLVN